MKENLNGKAVTFQEVDSAISRNLLDEMALISNREMDAGIGPGIFCHSWLTKNVFIYSFTDSFAYLFNRVTIDRH